VAPSSHRAWPCERHGRSSGRGPYAGDAHNGRGNDWKEPTSGVVARRALHLTNDLVLIRAASNAPRLLVLPEAGRSVTTHGTGRVPPPLHRKCGLDAVGIQPGGGRRAHWPRPRTRPRDPVSRNPSMRTQVGAVATTAVGRRQGGGVGRETAVSGRRSYRVPAQRRGCRFVGAAVRVAGWAGGVRRMSM
jgi:hypothetical protein